MVAYRGVEFVEALNIERMEAAGSRPVRQDGRGSPPRCEPPQPRQLPLLRSCWSGRSRIHVRGKRCARRELHLDSARHRRVCGSAMPRVGIRFLFLVQQRQAEQEVRNPRRPPSVGTQCSRGRRHAPDLAHLGGGYLQQPCCFAHTATFIQRSADAIDLERRRPRPAQALTG